jgi:hypothetical protein
MDLFEAWISLQRPEPNPLRSIRAQQRQRQSALLQRVEKAFAPLVASGISITLPSLVYEDHPLKYFPRAYSVADPCQSIVELTQVLGATYEVRDVADFFYFVPLWRGARFIEGAFRLSAEQLTKMAEGVEQRMHDQQYERLHALEQELAKGAVCC